MEGILKNLILCAGVGGKRVRVLGWQKIQSREDYKPARPRKK